MSPSNSSTSARPAPPAAESLAGRLAAMTHDLLGAASTADRRLVWTNPAWYPLLGWTEEELQAGSYHRLVHPDDLPRLKRAEAALLEGRGGERPEIELRLRGRDGAYRWVAFSASHSPADGLVFVSGKDVTARRKGEEELRNADQRYRAVTDSTRDGIVSADINGRIIFWNAGAETIFGRDAADALGRPLADLMPERYRDAHRAGMARFLATGQGRLMGSTVEVEGLRADGSEFPLELTLGTWTQSGQRCFTGVLRDVSERVRSRQALRKAEERAGELERSNAELEQFASVASHDLSEPLRMVSRYLQLLRRRDHQFEPVDTHAAAERAAAAARVHAEETGVRIAVAPLPTVHGDAQELDQLFQNLVGNAVKFVPEGRAAEVEIGAERDGPDWRFTVADSGIGFDPADADRIFGMFQRLHSRDEYRGTGIGLAIAKQVVERHGGRIWAEPRPAGGSRFCFTLPAEG